MDVARFVETLGAEFYTGVPDSQLKALCNYLMDKYGIDPQHHVIAANEGNCVALAAGYYLATGKIPVVYMQNSGEGNIVNPVASLLNRRVYGIPTLFVVGWRGEPGIHDEPQHIYQGEITLKLLEDMEIQTFVIGSATTVAELQEAMEKFREWLSGGQSAAFVIQKGALSFDKETIYKNQYSMTREEIIRHIVRFSGEDPVISTTGKASRELFEIREQKGQSHQYDFLTVGSMGHASSIALGVSINQPNRRCWCIDGDGALLMHMGAIATIGFFKPRNLIHIVINNGAHETVGGMPTVAADMECAAIAKACGYVYAVSVDNFEDMDRELEKAKDRNELTLIEIKCAIGARDNLGRPTVSPIENRNMFMRFLDRQHDKFFLK